MANLKEVRNRIASVTSTQQITKAMKMVSAAKLKRATDAVTQMKPYSDKLSEILANVSAGLDTNDNIFGKVKPVKKVLIIAITSDKGLCGGFNSYINKKVGSLVNTEYANKDVEVLTIGKKVGDYCRRENIKSVPDFMDMYADVSFDNVKRAAEYAMEGFVSDKYDVVRLVYNEFKNVAVQIVQADQFLPIIATVNEDNSSEVDYIFEPSKQEILEGLIPKSLKTQFYTAILNSVAGEHGARMSAMDKATDNAGELLKDLKLIYNRTRQAAITTEILEIVGGAEALAAGK